MTILDNHQAFLALVRLGLGHHADMLPHPIDWSAIHTIAEKQGLLAVALDGINQLPEDQRPPKVFMLKWIGEVMQGYEQRYELYRKAVEDLAAWYHAHGYRMMLLKGLACGKNWPKPDHRPYGDIDIYLFGQQKEADAEMVSSFRLQDSGFRIDNSYHHHSVFNWQGFTVENHYDFMNVHHHKSNAKIEKTFKALANDDGCFLQIEGEKVYLPPPNLNALFLLRHTMAHFAAEQITIRHILDWAFFVKAHKREVDWGWLECLLDEFGMMLMYRIINAICVEDLGFDAGLFPEVQSNLSMKDKVMNEILNPEFGMNLPKNLFRRVRFKIRRWRGSAWKHELCYNDSMWNAFWSGIWGHLLKPTTI